MTLARRWASGANPVLSCGPADRPGITRTRSGRRCPPWAFVGCAPLCSEVQCRDTAWDGRPTPQTSAIVDFVLV